MAKEYIEKAELLERFELYRQQFIVDDDCDTALTIIHGTPVDDDLEEVVRCRECRYAEPMTESEKFLYLETCVMCMQLAINGNRIAMFPNDFCSYGERKDGADNV